MRFASTLFVVVLLNSCSPKESISENGSVQNLLHDIEPYVGDSMVNVVIEIPAGTNQKWELNKETGQLEWQRLSKDSLRIIDYLPYPANYGFIPQTLLSEETGGDGDPVDVFILGPVTERGTILSAKVIAMISMMDQNENDNKVIAVNVNDPVFKIENYEMLLHQYPGVIEILKLWLMNYKHSPEVEIIDVKDENEAFRYIERAYQDYLRKPVG